MHDTNQQIAPPRPAVVRVEITPLFVYDVCLKGRNPNTLRAYRQAYADFARFLDATDPTGDPDPRMALAVLCAQEQGAANALAAGWRNHMIDGGLTRATVKMRVGALRSFVLEANRLGLVPWLLNVKTKKPKEYRNTAGPGYDAYKAMLGKVIERIDSREADRKGRRDLAILRLLHDNGLRRSEVEGLDWPADVDVRLGRVRIVGKGEGDPAWVTVPRKGMDALREWIALRGDAPGPLFVNLDRANQNPEANRRLSDHGIYEMVKAYAALLGLDVSPHKLRHGGITRAVERTNGNANAVRLFARHARLDTTQLYIDNKDDVAGEVAKRVAEDDD